MDPVGLVQGALAPLQRARDAIQGAPDLKTNLRRRYGDYSSILESLKSKPDVIAANGSERELRQLTELFTRVADLVGEYTAAPADGRLTKFNTKTKRAAYCKDVKEELDDIDADVMRQLAIMNLKGVITSSEMEVLQSVHEKVDRLTSVVKEMRPPSLPDMAAVPAGVLVLPRSYVERPGVQEAVDDLINPEKALAPYTVVGMGGGGKTVLVSAVVRESSVREHFRGGVFWMRVGRGARNSPLSLLQGLAREMGAAPTDAPHGVPHVLDSLEQVKQHLASVASTGTSPRLVVLDDVWEREVVDALLALRLKVLVTTRDRSVVGVPGGWLELGDMTEDEAVELLLKTSVAAGQPGNDVRTRMTKVVTRCGRLPLALAIAGSMPVVKGKGLIAGAWEELIKRFENVAKMMRARGEQSSSLGMVLEASFDALSEIKQEEVLKTAVLAAGAVAPIEMLLNLWDTKDTEGTREEAEGLVSKCLLQDVGGAGYRVHDLVLEFLKIKIKADAEVVAKATSLQAQYLARLHVVMSYDDSKHGAGNQGLFVLDALWRSVEKLSGDDGLEVAAYRASLEELESCEATEDMACFCGRVGFLFKLQGKYEEAEPLYKRSLAIGEKVYGPDHTVVASRLHNWAELLRAQGKYAEAEPLYERSLAIDEKVLGPEHSSVATSLNNWALLLLNQGKYAQAEPLFERCQAIEEKILGPEHPELAATLSNRALLLQCQDKYNEAEPLFARAVAIGEEALGLYHPHVAVWLNNLAELLREQGKYAEAEPLHERCQTIMEKVLGPEHPSFATTLHNRARVSQRQGKYAEAESLFERCQLIKEKVLGPEHPGLAVTLQSRAMVFHEQGKYAEAEPLYERCLAIREKVLDPEHPHLTSILNSRARFLADQGKHAEAEPLYERCQAIEEKILGPEHPELAITLHDRARLLEDQGKLAEAEPLYEWCQAIQEKCLGPEHPQLAITLHDRARLLADQGKLAEAEPLYERCQSIQEKCLGPEHPYLATTRHHRARLLADQGKYVDAAPLYERCQAIDEKVLGAEHPDLATTLHHRARLLEDQDKHNEALPLLERAFSIRRKKLGDSHHATVDTQISLERVRKHVGDQATN